MKATAYNTYKELVDNYTYTQSVAYGAAIADYFQSVLVRGRIKSKWMEDEIMEAYALFTSITKWLRPTTDKDQNFMSYKDMRAIESRFNKLVEGSATIFALDEAKNF
jgi:hypothetical protein